MPMTRKRHTAKKKQWENHPVKPAETTPTQSVSSPAPSQPEPLAPTAPHSAHAAVPDVHPLMAEVQSFLSRRDELARKLSEEIEVTEKKLAELRSTLASLFPDGGSNGQSDRKAKKKTKG